MTAHRTARPSAAEWMPTAGLVLHLADGSTETLSPERLRAHVSRLREAYRQAVGRDDTLCLVPDGRAPFRRYLTELLAALGLPNPVVVPDGETGAPPTAERLAALGLAAHTLGHERQPWNGSEARTALPPSTLLLRTGGTSGRVRYAVNTSMRGALGRDPRLSLASSVGLKAGLRVCLAGSVRHAATLSMLLDALNQRAEIHLFEKPDPAHVLHEVRRHRVHWLLVTPLHMRMMQRQWLSDGGAPDLRTLVHMSAVCAEPVKRFWHATLGPEHVYEVFGASEGIGTTVARGDGGRRGREPWAGVSTRPWPSLTPRAHPSHRARRATSTSSAERARVRCTWATATRCGGAAPDTSASGTGAAWTRTDTSTWNPGRTCGSPSAERPSWRPTSRTR